MNCEGNTFATRNYRENVRKGTALECVNIDGLADPDIMALGERIGRTPTGKEPRPGTARALLVRYCELILRARDHRRRGSYGPAFEAEREAETVYRGLPKRFRW